MTLTTPRSNVSQQTDFLRKRVDASVPTPNMATGVLFPNGLPMGAVIVGATVAVNVAFNGTTPHITVGTTPGGTNIVGAAEAAGAVGSVAAVAWQTGAQVAATADQDVYVTVTGAPTLGQADVVIEFCPNIDG
jgi:hypothetical protein